MKKLSLFCFLFFLFVVMTANSAVAQEKLGVIGKKFTTEEAKVLFGKIVGTVKISKAELKEALANAKEYVFIAVKNNRAHVLNEKKESLIAKSKLSLAKEEKAYMFSKSVVEEFVNTSTADVFTVELRASVLSVSDGFTTLEEALPCPPTCWF